MTVYRVPVQVNLEMLVEAEDEHAAFRSALESAEELAKEGRKLAGVQRASADGEIIDVEEEEDEDE